LAHGLWAGTVEPFAFVESMVDAIARNYEIAWREGAAQCQVTPEERTPDEWNRLRRELRADQDRIIGFLDYIVAHSKDRGGAFSTVEARATLWSNRYMSIVVLASVTSCADQKMMWRCGGTSDHCPDCAAYNGKVYRNSTWAKWGAIPRSHALACGGWNCDCRLDPTKAPVTPGHPRSPTGGF
jgi:hypothetical protein